MNQLPIIWTPPLSLPDRLRANGVMYAWWIQAHLSRAMDTLALKAAARIEELESER